MSTAHLIDGLPYITVSGEEMKAIRNGKNMHIQSIRDFVSGPKGMHPGYLFLEDFVLVNRDNPKDRLTYELNIDKMEDRDFYDGMYRVYQCKNDITSGGLGIMNPQEVESNFNHKRDMVGLTLLEHLKMASEQGSLVKEPEISQQDNKQAISF